MKYNRFGYLVGEGISNIFKNKKASGAALVIMFATMLIFGLFIIIGKNVNYILEQVQSEQGFQVFLKTDATKEEIETAGDKIRQIDGVSTVVFKSKEDALNSLKEKLKDKQGLLEGINNEILSTSYVITLTDLSKTQEIQDTISSFENIKKITTNNESINMLLKIAKGIRIVTGVILILLIFISIFIISNTIKLTVYARRKEISIMKYVGATNWFIRWPFIVEGIIIGIVAGIITILLVGGGYSLIADYAVNSDTLKQINISLISFKDMLSSIVFVYMVLGIGIGALGSSISMKKYLEV